MQVNEPVALVVILGIFVSITLSIIRPGDSERFRYRVTVYVEQGEKTYAGTAIREAKFSQAEGYFRSLGTSLAADAIAIDRGPDASPMFVLLKDLTKSRMGLRFETSRIRYCFEAGAENVVPKLRAIPVGAQCEHFTTGKGMHQPMVIAFHDESDVTTANLLNGPEAQEHGETPATLSFMLYERVPADTPITRNIFEVLPALVENMNQPKAFRNLEIYRGPVSTAPLAALLTDNDFRS